MQFGKNNKTIIITIVVLTLVFLAILITIGVIISKGLIRRAETQSFTQTAVVAESQASNTPQIPTPQATNTPDTASPTEDAETHAEPSPTAEATATPTQNPSVSLDPETEAIMDSIEEQVREIRRLDIDHDIPRRVLSPEELNVYVNEDLLEDFDETASTASIRRFALLGLYPRDLEMRSMLEDLYSEQIAGFYRTEEREMFVVAGEKFGINEKMTYAHEYIHALQFTNFDIENELGYSDEGCEEDSERCIAIQALIEGDATLSQFKWFENFATRSDYIELLESMETYESPALDSAPPYLSASMMFPYEYGTNFVQYLYDQRGYQTVNNAFTSQPPVTSEQIMFPERYPDDLPVDVELPDFASSMGGAWETDGIGVVGAWDIYLTLTKGIDESFQLDNETAMKAVEGWGGDAYVFLVNELEDSYLFVMKTVWDTEEDSAEAWDAFVKMLRLRFGWPSNEGVYSRDGYLARLFKTGDNGFVLIISEQLESLNQVYDMLTID
ncbi:MAG TPA: hypothetical protein PK791_03565 [Anaerolineaceae bacterium]|nr:hypothetical protein [Anaerolineaceae bacterium]